MPSTAAPLFLATKEHKEHKGMADENLAAA
jgi:hypothetical protein